MSSHNSFAKFKAVLKKLLDGNLIKIRMLLKVKLIWFEQHVKIHFV